MTKAIEWSDLELVEVLGEGQAGKVWLAKLKRQFKDFPVGSPVAVKAYKSWVLEQPGQFERIIRELELGRRINHPNLVKTLSVIRDPEGKPALVMDYYAGETFENYLKEKRDQSVIIESDFAFKCIGELASVIHAIHQAGAIHRDVKPANITLSENSLILMDLGVISSNDFPEQTTSGAFLGTIRYAAPEYLFGDSYNSSVDIYALGAITFEIFGGKPFPSEETQWARLIIEKSKHGIPSIYHTIKRRYGLNVTEFVRFIFEHTLTESAKRVIDMNNFLDAINNRLWEKPFYIADGKLVEGEPKVHYLGQQKEESQAPLCQVVEELKEKTTKEDREFLHQLLEEKYQSFYNSRYWSFMFGNRKDNLKRAGCLINEIKVEDGTGSVELHEAVLAAYRYGYL